MFDQLIEGEQIDGVDMEQILQRFLKKINFLYFPEIDGIPKSRVLNFFMENHLQVKNLFPDFEVSVFPTQSKHQTKTIDFQ